MSASKQAKQAGIKNLATVSKKTGVRTTTLNNWYNNKPKLFNIVIKGCLVESCFSCETYFIAETHNDLECGWFCDSCLTNNN
jgi:hypothetical protein